MIFPTAGMLRSDYRTGFAPSLGVKSGVLPMSMVASTLGMML